MEGAARNCCLPSDTANRVHLVWIRGQERSEEKTGQERSGRTEEKWEGERGRVGRTQQKRTEDMRGH
jgi:hypothetical protein